MPLIFQLKTRTVIRVKIELEVPDWVIGKHIYLFAGTELLATKEFRREKNRVNGKIEIKEYYLPIKIKADQSMRCNGCGDCCSTGGAFASKEIIDEMRKRLSDYVYSNEGNCVFFDDEIGCIMKGSIPFSCAKSNCEGWTENCTEKLIQLEVL